MLNFCRYAQHDPTVRPPAPDAAATTAAMPDMQLVRSQTLSSNAVDAISMEADATKWLAPPTSQPASGHVPLVDAVERWLILSRVMTDSISPSNTIDSDLLSILRCPLTRSKLRQEGDWLIAEVGGLRYPIRDGIPVMLIEEAKLPAGFDSLETFKRQFGVVT